MVKEVVRFTQDQKDILHAQALDEAVEIAQKYPDAVGYLILDLDDVVANPRDHVVEVFHRYIRRFHPDKMQPSKEEAKKGVKAAYEQLLGREKFINIWKRIEGKERHFRNAPLVDSNLGVYLEELAKAGIVPIMCLTARNAEQTYVSRLHLQDNNLPDLPVYADYNGDSKITDTKMSVLKNLAGRLPGKRFFMVDDNPDLIKKLDELQDPYMIGIQYETLRFGHEDVRYHAIWPTMRRVVQGALGNEQAA